MPTRICHVTSVHPSLDARIFLKECISLSKKYEVFLIAPNVQDVTLDGIHIIGVPLPKGRFKRLFRLSSVYKRALSINASIYHFHDPELISIGNRIKKRGKKVIFDSHEDIPNQILQKGYIPSIFRKLFSSLYSKYEKNQLKRFDALISVTPQIVNRLKRINPNTYLVTNFPIYFEKDDKRKWEKKVCFTGMISPNWMLDRIIDSIVDLDVYLELAGPCCDPNYISKLKQLPGWSKVHYLGLIPHEQVAEIHQNCIAGLAIESYDTPNAYFKEGSLGMTKIVEYMSIGIPVIASDTDIWGGIIRKNDCGICVNPDDSESIKQAILFYAQNPSIAKYQGDNAKAAVRNTLNWGSQERVLLEMYDSIDKKKHNNEQ